jgi:predicted short-subunit dehydrogenase-like oxidoreductase (DUF2520 family)
MDVAVVGAGRVGTALAVLLRRAGHRIVGVSGRGDTSERAARYLAGVPVEPAGSIAERAEVVIVATPDDRIAGVCSDLAAQGAFRRGQFVVHLSGATGLASLAAAKSAGAAVLCAHPLQTFPDVDSAIERVPGSGIAVTADDERGYELGERLARDVGGRPFRVPDELKPLYHAGAVFASNYVVTVLAIADELFRDAGLDDPVEMMLPLVRSSVDAVERSGALAALTGPVVRGDAGTIERNLQALHDHAPSEIPAYAVLARAALDRATSSGRLDAASRTRLDEVLDRWG